jgi:hypothetical protein
LTLSFEDEEELRHLHGPARDPAQLEIELAAVVARPLGLVIGHVLEAGEPLVTGYPMSGKSGREQ